MSTPELPDKLYFKIGEVAKLVGVKPYVLRYWESEFSVVRPEKTRSRHRLYRRKDVETLLEIRRLLHDERYTIAGAKRRLRRRTPVRAQRREAEPLVAAQPVAVQAPPALTLEPPPLQSAQVEARQLLSEVRRQLIALCERLDHQPRTPAPLVIGGTGGD